MLRAVPVAEEDTTRLLEAPIQEFTGFLVDPNGPWRESLYVRKTPNTGWALFTAAPIAQNRLIGLYTGTARDELTPQQQEYAIGINKRVSISPDQMVYEDGRAYVTDPLAFANEPMKMHTANMQTWDVSLSPHNLEKSTCNFDKVNVVAFFACRNIKAGEELTWHYGSSYQEIRDLKGYEPGLACKVKAKPWSTNESPEDYLMRELRELKRRDDVKVPVRATNFAMTASSRPRRGGSRDNHVEHAAAPAKRPRAGMWIGSPRPASLPLSPSRA
tara:strand:+ start:271 stop:1089 length:819 start_codon:yes stop_codon:yes gene_type:complete